MENQIAATVNEIYSTMEIKQTITINNKGKEETQIQFPILENTTLTKFKVQIEDSVIESKVMPKVKAEEKYNDSMASGNKGFLAQASEENYIVTIGNLNTGQIIVLTTEYYCLNTSDDESYLFTLPHVLPQQQTEAKDNKMKEKISCAIHFQCTSPITRLICRTDPLSDAKFNDNDTQCDVNMNYTCDSEINNETKILFKTRAMNQITVYEQYNPSLKEYYYSFNYFFTEKDKTQEVTVSKPDTDNQAVYSSMNYSSYPGIFIFVLDQSGSMDHNIGLVIEAMLLFIQSLPKNSYFDVYGFGSQFKHYSEKPLEYTPDKMKTIIKTIKSLNSDLGGTNALNPLKEIFTADYSQYPSYPKNIFLLTDGETDDPSKCIEITKQYCSETKFRLHSYGIGNGFNKSFIDDMGKVGKGTSAAIQDLSQLNKEVINSLRKAVNPYLSDIQLTIDIDKGIEYPCAKKKLFVYQNEIMNYSFVTASAISHDTKYTFTGKNSKTNEVINQIGVMKDINKLKEGNELAKIIVSNYLRAESVVENTEKELAMKYQIISKETSLFAEKEGQTINCPIKKSKNDSKYQLSSNYSSNFQYNNMIFCSAPMQYACPDEYDQMVGCDDEYDQMVGCEDGDGDEQMADCCDDGGCGFTSSKAPSSNFRSLNAPCESSNSQFAGFSYQSSPKQQVQKENSFDLKKLITTQDMFEGCWDENEQIALLEKTMSEVAKKIGDYLPKNIKNREKIKATFLVLYHLCEVLKGSINEYQLIIIKANEYLSNNQCNYEKLKAVL